ncbi:YpdA family putative bacillithiol disulfide reductase [Telmatobacter sp. DSM 110680]|uniref:YpdA family putative bacillithiol disulfide reductase n=1 Tax=Telmatobacter sp. DSM 110680 TaxID=3036704 RepID=A0AAU7DSQ9_9BACT
MLVRDAAKAADTFFDVLVIGAGPTGLACAIEVQKAGFTVALVDKGCICNSLFHYPSHMTFFTTPELLEIGGIPFPSPNPKPTRNEALQYYRLVAAHYKLDVRQYERVERVMGEDGEFTVRTEDRFGRTGALRARKLIVSTGYYDLPNLMCIPGESLSKVFHYYNDPHPYFDMDVVVIGGKNSSAIAALELWRSGARVTLVHRHEGMHRHVKYWIKPDIENRIKNGEIEAYFNTDVVEITQDAVVLKTREGLKSIKNDFVFAMTGYHPDFNFLESMGVRFVGPDRLPVCNAETLESNVPGIFLAGVIVAGSRTNEIFIENGRFHGGQIAQALLGK